MPDQTDPIVTILRSVPASDAVRASAWDAYQSAANEDDLATTLKTLPLPQHVKAQLWDLKHSATKPPDFKTETVGDSSLLGTVGDVAIGAAKGVANTVTGLGEAAYRYVPGVSAVSDAVSNAIDRHYVSGAAPLKPAALTPERGVSNLVTEQAPAPGAFDQARAAVRPTNTAQKTGYYGEQIGEFFLPTGATGKVAKAAEVAKSGVLSLAQSGSPTQAGVSAGLTAVLPGAGAAKRAAGVLEDSAQATMANALRATKEWAKDESEKLAPEMLERGIGGTFKSMRTLARQTAAKVGKNLDDAYAAAAKAGETVPGDVIRGNVQLASDALHVRGANGQMIRSPATKRPSRSSMNSKSLSASSGRRSPLIKPRL
jgi:hypothetical protein